ncbi:hypothetical protein AWQ21_02450 [Picosynechococcus sp. PCC 7003]|uniref:hypothetical protein n=1 Tax=Picosynechococcus sp. PCC 7003 TaxID=374981 RepID=UPI0008107813|nr:hypothetical protein [Picosynechococcus sp. PCC 7003]ANV83338.1 hypothetical protein AWQ21_02450 [Picosynechococcus sp. PCC 7003]
MAKKGVYVGTGVLGILFACVIAFPGLSLGGIVATLGEVELQLALHFRISSIFFDIILLIGEPFCIGAEIAVSDQQGIIKDVSIWITGISISMINTIIIYPISCLQEMMPRKFI